VPGADSAQSGAAAALPKSAFRGSPRLRPANMVHQKMKANQQQQRIQRFQQQRGHAKQTSG